MARKPAGDLVAVTWTAGGLASLGAQLGGAGAPWWADLMSPFALHAALALFAAAMLWAYQRRPIVASFTVLALVVQLSQLWPLWFTEIVAPTGPERLTVLHVNALVDNREIPALAAQIGASDADVAVIVELSPTLDRELRALPPPWRAWATRPGRDAFGIGVYARVAATSTAVRQIDHVFPAIEATLPGGQRIFAVHIMPPIDEEATLRHRAQLAELASWVGTSTRSTLVVGDLNATPWSAGFLALEGLRTSALGHGYSGTWPSPLGALGIPIDHVMISAGLTAITHEVIELPGSDHRGLRVVVGPR